MRVFAFVIVAVSVGCRPDSSAVPAPVPPQPPPVAAAVKAKPARPAPVARIAATQMFWKFTNNPVEADQLYLGKYCEIAGKVDAIDKDANGRYSIQFGGYIDRPPHIYCYLASEALDDAAKLKAGDMVTIVGRVARSGKFANGDAKVEVDDCVFLKPN